MSVPGGNQILRDHEVIYMKGGKLFKRCLLIMVLLLIFMNIFLIMGQLESKRQIRNLKEFVNHQTGRREGIRRQIDDDFGQRFNQLERSMRILSEEVQSLSQTFNRNPQSQSRKHSQDDLESCLSSQLSLKNKYFLQQFSKIKEQIKDLKSLILAQPKAGEQLRELKKEMKNHEVNFEETLENKMNLIDYTLNSFEGEIKQALKENLNNRNDGSEINSEGVLFGRQAFSKLQDQLKEMKTSLEGKIDDLKKEMESKKSAFKPKGHWKNGHRWAVNDQIQEVDKEIRRMRRERFDDL